MVPLGRLLFSIIFIHAAPHHFQSGTVGYAASKGVPFPDLLVPLTGLMILAGGVSILLGFRARIGALLIILFLVPTTLVMHAFWSVADPQAAMIQQIMFLKNLSMLGGALIIFHFGAGPYSMDEGAGR
ncbi:MAG: DoxX family protein [Nitrospinae bacterium]|nr:DoxX family protein [Nitrospinota bacterium]